MCQVEKAVFILLCTIALEKDQNPSLLSLVMGK